MVNIEKIKENIKCPQFGDLEYGEWGALRLEQRIAYKELIEEVERLNKENNDLRKLYQRTYKHLFEKGNDELARYFQAQIDECPTFYVEPIIDYYEETKRLNSIIKEAREYIENAIETGNCTEDISYEYGIKKEHNYYVNSKDLLQILDKVEENSK